MRKLTSAVALSALIVVSGCVGPAADSGRIAGPRGSGIRTDVTGGMGACTTLSALTTLANEVFGSGSPNAQSAIGKLNNLDHFVQLADTAQAQAQAQNIVSFVQMKAEQGTLPGTTAQIDEFLAGVLCYAGLSPNTFLIQPTDNAQNLITNTGNSGVSLQAHTVSVPTLLTIDELPPDSSGVLVTKLDKYPTFIAITVSSQLLYPAAVAVCIPASLQVSNTVFSHLRLGHQASTGFEITPYASADFLGCPTSVASKSSMPGWLRELASLVLPKPLYANTVAAYAAGGVGGSAIQFSPFGAVDNSLYATGGVGGSSVQFQRMPSLNRSSTGTSAPGKASSGKPAATSGSSSPSYSVYDASGSCISADTTAGVQLNPLCRPLITIKTYEGTLMTNVPVAWAVTAGGGTIATDTLSDNGCGTFASTANNATDVNGQAAVCWTLGDTAGTNTVTATPTYGGDAPQGVIFVGASGSQETGVEFTATADLITTTATATGDTVTYDGLAHDGSGSCSNGLTPELSYNTTDGSAPVNAGPYTFTVTCGGGNVYAVSTATGPILINPATPVVAVSCPDSAIYTGSALTPCTATATAPKLNLTPTPTYTNNTAVGTATATVSLAAGGNYTAASGSATFRITKAASTTAVSCPTSIVYSAGLKGPGCTGTATGVGGLTQAVAVTYTPSTVRDVGTYTASATYGGDPNHFGSTGSTTFSVTKLGATATAGSDSMQYGGTVPSISCTVVGLLSPDTGSVTCTTSVPATLVPGNNVTTPVVSPTNPTNYAMTLVNGNLAVRYVQNDCFASPIYSSQPPTKSYQKIGSNLPIKCTLQTATGSAVTGATGSLRIQDMGTDGNSPGVVVLDQDNVFVQQNNKNYSYGFDTSNLTSGHYYEVTAYWNDGSTTTGWFYAK